MNFKKAYISHILVYNWLVRAPAHQELFLYTEVFEFYVIASFLQQ
jgi:hypothetical protein